jgi:hypothetical protein
MAWGRKPKPQPNEAFALDEQARAEGMAAYAAQHPEKDTTWWRTCARETFESSAENTAQPKKRPKQRRWGHP